MFLCDLKFFFVCITRQFDNVHSVKQRGGNFGSVVCRGYEEHFGKIDGHVDIMVFECLVLLRVKHFKQCRRRVSASVRTELVYLVKQHQRVHRSRFFYASDYFTRHGRDISASVTSYFIFVVDTAERNSDKLSVKSLCDALRN